MAHKWEHVHSNDHPFHLLAGSVRRCTICGAWQNYRVTDYNVMDGGTYRWRPLVGNCEGRKTVYVSVADVKARGQNELIIEGRVMDADGCTAAPLAEGDIVSLINIPSEMSLTGPIRAAVRDVRQAAPRQLWVKLGLWEGDDGVFPPVEFKEKPDGNE